MAQLDLVTRNLAAQTTARHHPDAFSLAVICSLLGSSLFSRPDDWSHLRAAFSSLIARRCRLSDLLLLPGCLLLDFRSGSLSCAPALAHSLPDLRLFFDSNTWRDIQSGPARNPPNVLAIDNVGTMLPTEQDNLLPAVSREHLLALGIPPVRVESVLQAYYSLASTTRDPPVVAPFADFYARDLLSYLLGKESGRDVRRFVDNLPPLDFSLFSRSLSDVFLVCTHFTHRLKFAITYTFL